MSRVFTSTPADSTLVTVVAAPTINSLSQFTVAAWVKLTAGSLAGNGQIITVKDPVTLYTFDFQFTGAGIADFSMAQAMDDTSYGSSESNHGTVTEGSWFHYAATFDSSGSKTPILYINAVVPAYFSQIPGTGAGSADDSAGNLLIGDDGIGNGLNGKLARLQIWNTPLTAVQIEQVYHGGLILPGSLVDSLTFLTDQGITEPDASGNGNVGAIFGATFSTDNPTIPGVAISGTVGVAGAGATIHLSGSSSATTTADGSGNYTFSNLNPAGNYLITPSLLGVEFSPPNRAITPNYLDVTGVNFLTFTPSETESNSANVLSSGQNFATLIQSPRTSVMGTNLRTKIIG